MVVATDRGRDAYTSGPVTPKGGLSMLNQSTTFGDPRLPTRFWAKVKLGSIPACRPDLGPCWVWTGWCQPTRSSRYLPYGRAWADDGKQRSAHRWAYERLVGPIPEGLTIDHLCNNPPCVNTAHLQIATVRQNLLRGNTYSGRNSRKTRCPRGHPYDIENTYIYPSGRRDCRACRRQQQLALRGTRNDYFREYKARR